MPLLAEVFASTQNYITKSKKCFAILKKNFCLQLAKSFTMLGMFIAKWISKGNSNAGGFNVMSDTGCKIWTMQVKPFRSFAQYWNIFFWGKDLTDFSWCQWLIRWGLEDSPLKNTSKKKECLFFPKKGEVCKIAESCLGEMDKTCFNG